MSFELKEIIHTSKLNRFLAKEACDGSKYNYYGMQVYKGMGYTEGVCFWKEPAHFCTEIKSL